MNKYKVLLVDDESDMRQLVGMYLDNFGYEWDEAENGKEALLKLEEAHYDFVILDIMMPEMDGIAVCKEIRKTSDIPIIFLTAKGEEWNRVNGLRNGADDYVVKPFSPGELIARMEAVLRRYTKQGQQEELEFGPIRMNEKSRKAETNGKIISLTVKEFDLLYFLCQHHGQVFSREQLLEKVWGYDYAGSTRTVDTHVKTMRLKLGESGNCIQTVWGVGYKFEV
ncbi:response regulator transcription factor [Bacillus cytotoxicus]|uniref:Two component transcriptional regulator, winged helix family n=1 Tax=Bacillus cytotoxicus (strain DSM 22905 / CIP 110041 / 391-98 / NVH 391-98) TaxID=315749 RepID=A7GMI9_BACCN|nr:MULTISPECIES: response regulator transcription factor [Bacillus cereus group]ABS21347.1 two component transcriptional regulator, winged helix family [Bacillus cytotoxicus NVH 391-98]AWC44063.1 DNA-binding response regulator [Bacillus cytotoxicus]MDH2862712.1 response regulator transcription factor [Bacillus cytotoxicus]MDH2879132.1 response regulator transcription factor [Bacillus cytotoxicus]MDH2883359.1 response regulator transcription factor [Bacillus cytotoxicus]